MKNFLIINQKKISGVLKTIILRTTQKNDPLCIEFFERPSLSLTDLMLSMKLSMIIVKVFLVVFAKNFTVASFMGFWRILRELRRLICDKNA